ncbi:zinc finger TRAF-type-containing protein 1 isoform X1 [Manis pentadactyla]|uniref:zinc finger TRAF-type-containing protein 1 isoform X1 n=1 Tax=Manis pentadactyla TaxID=143292 RepID=UPI001874C341|nr:zinc finger TRAF-type-containing protein 1 isoform X1 [Manis pentadactyla]
MSGAEEAGGGVPAAGPAGAVPAGVGVGAAAGPAAAALGEAAGPGLPDEAGLAGVRQLQEAAGDPDAPPKKRLRAAEAAEAAAAAAGSGKLEERLYSVLCCTVCLDLPKASVYQCTNGHLMCAGCFIHLLADARLKEEQATCPNCRCEISKSLCCRNLAVEKAVSELPSECGFCLRQFPRSLLERHQKEECQDRVTQCKYKRIGCPWHGPFHELTVHESACAHPTKTGNELMEILDEMDQSHRKEMQLYNSIFSLLSFEKIGYTGGHCTGHRPPRPARRCSEPGLQNELRVSSSKCRAGSGCPGMGKLDHTQACCILWALLATATAFGHVREQAPGQSLVQTQNSKKHLLMLGPQGDSSPLLPSPRQEASLECQGRSWAASHTKLPGLGLARCGPAQAQEAEGPRASAAEGHGP